MKKIKARVEIRIPSFIPGGTYVKFMVFLPLSPFTAMNEIFVFIISLFSPLTVAENPKSYGTLKKIRFSLGKLISAVNPVEFP